MWFRKKEKSFFDEYQEESKRQQQKDFIFLEEDRIFAIVWADVCRHGNIYKNDQIERFESLVKEGVCLSWGPCDFDFNREKQTIIVKARDGRTMELVSGEIISEIAS